MMIYFRLNKHEVITKGKEMDVELYDLFSDVSAHHWGTVVVVTRLPGFPAARDAGIKIKYPG